MIFGCYRETENTLYDLFTIPTPRITKENVRKCIYPTANPNIDIIPGNEDDDAICTDVENDRSRLVQLILKYILANNQRNMTENFKQQKARRLIQFYEMKQEQTGEKINVTKKVSEELGIDQIRDENRAMAEKLPALEADILERSKETESLRQEVHDKERQLSAAAEQETRLRRKS